MVKKSPGRPKKFDDSQTGCSDESVIYLTLDKMSYDYSKKEGKLDTKGDLGSSEKIIENESKL